jgi:hypothetical protein
MTEPNGIWSSRYLTELYILGENAPSLERERLRLLQATLTELTTARWNSMKAIYDRSSVKGQEAMLSGILYQQWGCAGRLLVTLRTHTPEDGEIYLSFVGDLSHDPEDPATIEMYGGPERVSQNGRCGLQGMCARPETAIWMMDAVHQAWDESLFLDNANLTMV